MRFDADLKRRVTAKQGQTVADIQLLQGEKNSSGIHYTVNVHFCSPFRHSITK